jgi:acetylornithine deacetylase/succinyl-diaminopimelate desuccinylase-like protein
MERDDPVVHNAQKVHASQFDQEGVLGVWQFSTNGVATKGMFGIPTIGYGPGREEHAHTRDDQVRVDDLVKAAEFYAAFALNQVATEPRAMDGFGPTGTR